MTGDDAGTSCTDTYNCKLTYTCDNGYDLIDARQPICQENGQWSYQKSRCERELNLLFLIFNIPVAIEWLEILFLNAPVQFTISFCEMLQTSLYQVFDFGLIARI